MMNVDAHVVACIYTPEATGYLDSHATEGCVAAGSWGVARSGDMVAAHTDDDSHAEQVVVGTLGMAEDYRSQLRVDAYTVGLYPPPYPRFSDASTVRMAYSPCSACNPYQGSYREVQVVQAFAEYCSVHHSLRSLTQVLDVSCA